jgi:hypothetical protein
MELFHQFFKNFQVSAKFLLKVVADSEFGLVKLVLWAHLPEHGNPKTNTSEKGVRSDIFINLSSYLFST